MYNLDFRYCLYKLLTKLFNFIFSGQSPAEADLNLLETARRCELYGVKMHSSKVSIVSFICVCILDYKKVPSW